MSPSPETLLTERTVEVWGWAWAAAGVTGLEVSTDGGTIWRAASLKPRSQWSWQRFHVLWQPAAEGRFTLMARATDATGRSQPASRARNAVHALAVDVARR